MNNQESGAGMMYCNHNCNGFGKYCGFRTQDGFCALSQTVKYTDHTEETKKEDNSNSV